MVENEGGYNGRYTVPVLFGSDEWGVEVGDDDGETFPTVPPCHALRAESMFSDNIWDPPQFGWRPSRFRRIGLAQNRSKLLT